MRLRLDINVSSQLWRGLPKARSLARAAVAAALAESAFTPAAGAEASLMLADDATVRALNARFRGQNKPTNVLSFPAAPGQAFARSPTLGDIALAYETMAREAEDMGRPLADHFRHLVAHGFLHLIGYDHAEEAEAERMEGLERRALARLGVPDPYRNETDAA